MSKTIVEFNSIVKQYGTLNAVDGISFKINEEDVFAFLGPNSAGKTKPLRFLSVSDRLRAGPPRSSGTYSPTWLYSLFSL